MKTLDEIINRQDYKKLNGALVARSIELAEKIRQAFYSAEIERIGDYKIITVKSRSGYSYTSLCIFTEKDEYRSLEDSETRYFAGDYNCKILSARGCDRLKFLNCARTILDEIDAIKEERIDDMKKALEASAQL